MIDTRHRRLPLGLTCLYQLMDLDDPRRGPGALAELLSAAGRTRRHFAGMGEIR